jgi:hypothetical protein
MRYFLILYPSIRDVVCNRPSIVADQASSAFRISRAAVRRMERADAVLASMFHRRMATIAAERAADSVRLLTAGSG